MALPYLLILGIIHFLPAARSLSSDVVYTSEFYSQIPQQLSFYSWYGNARLFQFRVPPDTALLRWLLQASRDKADCGDVEITVHFRHGAPPVINPLGTAFSPATRVPYSFNMPLTFTNSLNNNTFLNITNPEPGDWYIVAHLPKDPEKIQIQGFTSTCKYFFQPDLFILREVGIPILQAGAPMQKTLSPPGSSANFKMFIPEYTQDLRLQLQNCTSDSTPGPCPLLVTVGSVSELPSIQRTVNCSEGPECAIPLRSPPWGKWLNVLVELSQGINASVSFEIVHQISACKPGKVVSRRSVFTLMEQEILKAVKNATDTNETQPLAARSGSCLHKYPLVREDMDVVSVRFQSVKSPYVPVTAEMPSIMLLNLDSEMDSGGMLIVSLQLNKTTMGNSSASVLACLSADSPVLALNTSQNCTTAFSQGYALLMNSSVPNISLNLPYPVTASWYLSMQLLCPLNDSDCQSLSPRVLFGSALSPCEDNCGPNGDCRLFRRNSYLYAACSCKSGWSGWSCTDSSKALSYQQQLAATLLLTLSNFMFVPTIIVAVYKFYFVEAAVYAYNMFFSTFYHACDQPGEAVMCIMDYDTLQYCDFFGSVVSIWVTILCMARLKQHLKYVLFMLGTLLIALSMQLDRRGIWNMLGPCLFALVILVIAWTYRGVRRRHCYPPSWKRWLFYLVPGISLALIALAIYVFAQTNSNYFYTHSLWHIMVAGSVAFLLPPRDRNKKPWNFKQLLGCRYKICHDDREELFVVT
ncbi:hypothetical protein XENTR_v10023767 [Xenopus tropicalis]|uniref:Post-GPI attachment to proteins factor 6 isoform X1 n=1 Tax=Xenopus tropicalis TaxID=8364 RepID=A0A803K629_XENTR|nr:post-GPI attachment to proteins factor 6 isoform X1 [Xenopus tropicalis]KAE8578774.1 hypothetical protein XENTR_v10023767 [Xenopus tropicalis]|eukprot:XP_004918153.1 PREDICTED: transmembrane protein 8A isoform X1 [Xenopus tropicalis]